MHRKFITIFIALFLVSITFAQEECQTEVLDALAIAADACQQVGRNDACYGNHEINATLNETNALFDSVGNIVRVTQIENLTTSPYNTTNNTWGIALLRLQGDFPDTVPGQNVTLVLFGDVQAQNATPVLTEINATTNASTRVRSTPDSSSNANILTNLPAGTSVVATGRNEAGDWVRIAYDRGTGWTAAFLLDGVDELRLNVISPDAPIQTPMQAFYLLPGITKTSCASAPDTLLVMTPENAGYTTMTINGVHVTIGSTIQIVMDTTTTDIADMQIRVLTGGAIVRSADEVALVPAGTQTAIAIDTSSTIPTAASPPQTVIPVADEAWQQIQQIIESDEFNRLVATSDDTTTLNIPDEPLAEEAIETAAEAQFYPDGAVSGRYQFNHVSSNPILGGNSNLLCISDSFEQTVDWANLTYQYDGSSAPRIADNRFGATDTEHDAALNPSNTPDDAAFTEIAASWTITSPTTFTYRVSAGQNRTQFGRQACDNVWNAVWIGS